MDEATPEHLRDPSPTLAAALRRARAEGAERSDAVTDLHAAEVGRLDLLFDAIRPILEQVPDHIDLFDVGLVAGDRPRLYLDMIGFVEMADDRRTYRFVQNTRHGRVILLESDDRSAMVDAILDYVARRLVEREQALAGAAPVRSREAAGGPGYAPDAPAPAKASRRRFGTRFVAALLILIEYLGIVALLALLICGVFYVYDLAQGWTAAHSPPPPN